MSVEDIYNFILIDNLVATAGQPTADQLRALGEAGYSVVINLAPDGLETSLPEERELLSALGIEYHHLPVIWNAPQLDQLDQFDALMETATSRRTLIHCQANYRVTAFFALYAEKKRGWSEAEANALIDRIWKSKPGHKMDATWKAFVVAARKRRG